MMRDVLTKEADQIYRSLERYLASQFKKLPQQDHGDIIGNAFEGVLIDIDKIDAAYIRLQNAGEIKVGRGQFLYGCVKLRATSRALTALKSSRVKRTVSMEKRVEDELDGKVFTRPLGITWPDQEDVLFKKQLLEHCQALPPEECLMMRLAMDRATLDEMVTETGMTKSHLMARRASAMRKLKDKADSAAASIKAASPQRIHD